MITPVNVDFGLKLRQIRKQKKLTQEKLAYKAGLHPNYIGMIERGERNVSLKNIYKIAGALDITVRLFNDD